MTSTIIIFTRRGSGDCYVARAEGMTASCTSSPRQAAERLALKLKLRRKDVCALKFEEHGITLKQITEGEFGACQYKASWESAA